MSLRLDIRVCWKYECPYCDRVFRFPTTRSLQENGAFVVHKHMSDTHPEADAHIGSILWEKDHMANLREPT